MQPASYDDPSYTADLRYHLRCSLDPARVRPVIVDLLVRAHEPLTSEVIALAVLHHFGFATEDRLAVRVMAKRVALCLFTEAKKTNGISRSDIGWALSH